MLTDDMKKWIDLLLPAQDARSELLRRAVRLLAQRDSVLPLSALAAALARSEHALYIALTPWDGIRWQGTEGHITARLAPWVRKAIGLSVTSQELLADLGAASQDEDEPTAYHRVPPHPSHAWDAYGRCACGKNRGGSDAIYRCPLAKQTDPLADVRAAVAGCTNIATSAEALEHAYGPLYVASGP